MLLTGPSGVGKSELLLALIDRGHPLVSDDVTLIERHGEQIIGHAPAPFGGMMQIHGCGLFSVTTLYGLQSYRQSTALELIVALAPAIHYEADPLEPARDSVTLLGVAIPRITIPLPAPRNLPLLIELLVRKEIVHK